MERLGDDRRRVARLRERRPSVVSAHPACRAEAPRVEACAPGDPASGAACSRAAALGAAPCAEADLACAPAAVTDGRASTAESASRTPTACAAREHTAATAEGAATPTAARAVDAAARAACPSRETGAIVRGVILLLALSGCAGMRSRQDRANETTNASAPVTASEDDLPPPIPDAGCDVVPDGAVCLPGGLSELGLDRGESHFEERPPHAVRLAPFAIDRREVTTRAYAACVSAGRCGRPGCDVRRSSHLAVRCVSWADATAYCAFRNGRLPSEAEWERAAAGMLPSHRLYPWGDDLPESGTPRDRTPEGVFDLGGSLAEWTSDGGWFYPSLPRVRDAGMDVLDAAADVPTDVGEDAGSDDVTEDVAEQLEGGLYVLHNARGPSSSPWRVVRGGSETTPMNQRTSTLRRFRQPGDRLPWVGFRCVW